MVYASNEQGCSVTAYRFDRADGTLHPFHTVPTLPEGYSQHNSCSQIQITPSGKYLYAPNRGHNSIAGFAVNPGDGTLTPLGQTPTEAIPRAFSLDPSGNYLYAAGLESARLASYRVNADTGALEPLEVYPIARGPCGCWWTCKGGRLPEMKRLARTSESFSWPSHPKRSYVSASASASEMYWAVSLMSLSVSSSGSQWPL